MTKSAYHHGDLRAVLLRAAAEQIAADGVDAVSLRALAQRVGVSHAAPAHHFGNRQGLLTELAIEGFDLLAAELRSAAGDFREMAVSYIRFARDHPGHFDVMFRHDLLRSDDERLRAANERSGAELRSGVASLGVSEHDRPATELAAWSLVHGFASLWREGALADSGLGGGDPEVLARRMVAAIDFVGAVPEAGRAGY
ncbi:TetR/AcrR family transcriptional regulator [Nocardia terpenica]|uniref:TetR/AcrR family transcriptional regulator n=1 Tax=Nocardia terpenica TaxID=455432 RepID=UPI0018934D1E|nr:TetR/AcrR family transcriptional regulator [Nocardia terpenica]MBF6063419.1 TetR/AcrR family transcriptional regulator [Nocardia terpenica]MBF6105975.1 TetR/AcrR family transcriptional regulator [Nocardia terpenica]MBF6113440.1 TetR/AcrR family transcriptional regulator [Nocardia terpenica]MBF6119716.1 TetR/AcrR family transcriptional regulator [Nocardia terpenica]MBF6152127.1 TetR/AcrR family transcriptional regulator [Nocardia terpenica]